MILAALLLMQSLNPAPLTGIWSVGDMPNCSQGEAWVFTADGYYVEVDLASSQISAVGAFDDQGDAIEYTHAHIPFASAATPQERRLYKITARTPDRINALNYKGEKRAFHRCSSPALQRAHGDTDARLKSQ
ncbi:hypothetical protein [Sphingobium sp.]|uniref:hypothetical protein n=1 Tax=Sphingobium sp. TaxID=1912891 RepID=UPI002C46179D|nr:hypothetical protein [Sphingobium sp.]HUD94057.1 hypothetical protein [Sphingobium sp.]